MTIIERYEKDENGVTVLVATETIDDNTDILIDETITPGWMDKIKSWLGLKW